VILTLINVTFYTYSSPIICIEWSLLLIVITNLRIKTKHVGKHLTWGNIQIIGIHDYYSKYDTCIINTYYNLLNQINNLTQCMLVLVLVL